MALIVLFALVPVIVYLDTNVFAETMSEESLTESLHNGLLLVAIVAFLAGLRRNPDARGYLALATTLFGCMFLREYDMIMDAIWQGFWKVPAVAVLGVGITITLRNRGTVAVPFVQHMQSRQGTFVLVGVLLLVVFTRLFGTGALWEGVMGEDYSPAYKAAIQEGLELMSYLLIAYGSCASYLTNFGRAHPPSAGLRPARLP
jgi:hypothetical protein